MPRPPAIPVRLLLVGLTACAIAVEAVVVLAALLATLRSALQRSGGLPADVVGRIFETVLLAAVVAAPLALALVYWVGGRLAEQLAGVRSDAARIGFDPAGVVEHGGAAVAELEAIRRALATSGEGVRERAGLIARQRDEALYLLDTVGEGIVQLSADARIIRINAAARRLLRLPADAPEQAVGAVVRDPQLRAALERIARARATEVVEIPFDDLRLLLLTRPIPAGVASRERLGDTLVVLVDMTELRRLEGVRRDFVANVSHELKTPLTSIRGYAETLLENDLAPELRREFAQAVERNARRLQQIVDDLLDLSRIESGGWTPHPTAVDPLRVAEDAWSESRPRAERQGVTFHVERLAPERLRADPLALHQVFSNLFDNALRYTPAGGRITVRVVGAAMRIGSTMAAGAAPEPASDESPPTPACLPSYVTIEVADTGAGIPPAALPRIFERFYRVDPARSRNEGGTGLGLSIVKHLVEAMGGAVAAESELGRGTTIRLRFPAAVSSEDAVAPMLPQHPA